MKKKRIKIRRSWKINPRTKLKESAKVYRRGREKIRSRKIVREELS